MLELRKAKLNVKYTELEIDIKELNEIITQKYDEKRKIFNDLGCMTKKQNIICKKVEEIKKRQDISTLSNEGIKEFKEIQKLNNKILKAIDEVNALDIEIQELNKKRLDKSNERERVLEGIRKIENMIDNQ